MSNETTYFGFKRVPSNKKAKLVAGVFSSVAGRYDFMNDVMSMGIHRFIKRKTVTRSEAVSGDYVLDLAGGTGDLARHFSRMVGINGRVVLADINEAMLKVGQKRISKINTSSNVTYSIADAERLPFHENTFDFVAISFGMRNFTDKVAALHSAKKVLKRVKTM